jgi:hypothetical protein
MAIAASNSANTCRATATPRPLAARAQLPANMLRVALVAMVALLAAPLVGEAQQAQKTPRLCFLTFDPGTLRSRSPRFDAFFEALRDLGYVDAQTIIIDYLSADGDGERFPALTAECLRLKANIIAVSTTRPPGLRRTQPAASQSL